MRRGGSHVAPGSLAGSLGRLSPTAPFRMCRLFGRGWRGLGRARQCGAAEARCAEDRIARAAADVARGEDGARGVCSKGASRAVLQYHNDFAREKEEIFDVASDMTRQYKGMQEELLSRINLLEGTVRLAPLPPRPVLVSHSLY